MPAIYKFFVRARMHFGAEPRTIYIEKADDNSWRARAICPYMVPDTEDVDHGIIVDRAAIDAIPGVSLDSRSRSRPADFSAPIQYDPGNWRAILKDVLLMLGVHTGHEWDARVHKAEDFRLALCLIAKRGANLPYQAHKRPKIYSR